MADAIADLERREEEIRVQLDAVRALRSELLGTADVLNRERLA